MLNLTSRSRLLTCIFGFCIISNICVVHYMTSNNRNYNDNQFEIRLQGPLMGDDPALVSYVKQNYLLPPSMLPYNLTKKALTRLNSKGIEGNMFIRFAKKNLQHISRGFFIEAGALDGEIGANTLWLEYKRDWTGLLIEPSPENCANLFLRQRKAWASCSCINPRPYAEETTFEKPQVEKSSRRDLGMYLANFRSLRSRFHDSGDIIDQTVDHFTYSSVQCFPLITYLLALNITTIDLLSLDTQGGEKTMLYSIPYEKIKVKHIFVEYYKRGPVPTDMDPDFVKVMKEKNFALTEFSDKNGEYIFSLMEK